MAHLKSATFNEGGPYYSSEKVVGFMQGELVATARRVLNEYRDNKGLTDLSPSVRELERLIHNAFQYHGNSIGDPVQLAKLILFMHSEQTTIW